VTLPHFQSADRYLGSLNHAAQAQNAALAALEALLAARPEDAAAAKTRDRRITETIAEARQLADQAEQLTDQTRTLIAAAVAQIVPIANAAALAAAGFPSAKVLGPGERRRRADAWTN